MGFQKRNEFAFKVATGDGVVGLERIEVPFSSFRVSGNQSITPSSPSSVTEANRPPFLSILFVPWQIVRCRPYFAKARCRFACAMADGATA